MQLVIDTATSQRFLDFQLPWDANYRTVYLKLGGDNVDTYEAPWYGVQHDSARRIGYRCGHYWVPDANPGDSDTIDTAPDQADYYVDRLRGWTVRDFAVLDNENLDGGWRFGDVQAAEWIERVKFRKSIPGRQVLVYTNLSDARAITWDRVLATGANFIIAAPSYTAFAFPDIPKIPRERIVGHQIGTRSFGGVVTDINVFTDNAFNYGGSSVTLEDQMRQYAAANQRPFDEPTWNQMCGSLMFRFNTWRGWVRPPFKSIDPAATAGDNSGWLNPNAAAAPVGAWHFFNVPGVPAGHVMQDAKGGGWRCFTTGYSVGEVLSPYALGFQSVAGYVAAKNATYRGWSTNYAGGTIDLSGTAGGGTTPIPEGEEDMAMGSIHRPTGEVFFADEFGSENITTFQSPDIGHDEYVAAVVRTYGAWDDLTTREWDISVAVAQRRWAAKRAEIVNQTVNALKPLFAAIAAPGIDQAVLEAAVAKAIAANPVSVDYEAIGDAVADEQAERLAE